MAYLQGIEEHYADMKRLVKDWRGLRHENEVLRKALTKVKNLTTNQELSPGTVRDVGKRVGQIVDSALEGNDS